MCCVKFVEGHLCIVRICLICRQLCLIIAVKLLSTLILLSLAINKKCRAIWPICPLTCLMTLAPFTPRLYVNMPGVRTCVSLFLIPCVHHFWRGEAYVSLFLSPSYCCVMPIVLRERHRLWSNRQSVFQLYSELIIYIFNTSFPNKNVICR